MIVLFGIAGAGKGTQAEILARKLNCPVVSTGDILRQNADKPQVKTALEAGNLVSDEVLLPMVEQEFERIGADKNEFILDGTPRTVKQARWLDEQTKAGKIKFTAIIHIKLSEAAALRRLRERGRHDDTAATIRERFNFYQQSVLPAIEYLAANGYEVKEVSGDQPIEDVAADIERVLGL